MNESMRKDLGCLLALLLLSGALFGFQLGKAGLLDPDEPFYSLTAKEMLASRDPWTPQMFGEPQFEKPIFFYWVLYASFKYLGISEFSARLGPCVAGILTVLVVFLWGRTLFRRREPAFLAAAILATSGQFIVLSRIVLTDVFLCLFVSSALCAFCWGWRNEKARPLAWHLLFVFCALGFLTKGPLGLLIPFFGIASYAVASGEKRLFTGLPWASGLALFALIGFPWYLLMAKLHGTGFLTHFFMHENVRRFFVAEHRGMDRWFFYPFVLTLGFFPWGAFVLTGLGHALTRKKAPFFLALSFFVPFFFFTFAKSKLMSYIFPLYPVAALAAGFWFWKMQRAMRMGFSASKGFTLLSFFFWVVSPVALAAGAYFFAEQKDIPIAAPVAVISAVIVPLSWLAFYFLKRRNLGRAFSSMLVMTVLFSALAFGWMLPSAGSAFSSKRWAKDYARLLEDGTKPLFMTSKLFVRGMTFYTGAKDLGVFSSQPKGGFYTPHPIRIVTDSGELLKMEKDKFPVYFLLRGKEFGHLLDGLEPAFAVSVVKATTQRILVRLDRV